MWAAKLVSFAQNRFRRDRQNEEDGDYFSEPSIRVIAAPQTGRTPSNAEQSSEIHRSMPLLFNLCRRWAWPAIEFRCQSHPHEADARDSCGDTALHWVAFGNPPLEVVRALLSACPNLASIPNNEGKIPLHCK
jgi:Ankyrin repeat